MLMNKLKGQPLARSNITTVVNDSSSLWIFGGEDEASKLTNSLSEYLIDTQQWKHYNVKQFDQTPMERAGHSMEIYNDCIYIFGGDAGPKKGRLNDLWKFNLNKCNEKNAFQYVNTLGSMPTQRMKHSSTIYKSYMFVFGGCNDQNYENNNNDKDDAQSFNQLYIINLNDNKQPLTWYKISIKDLPQRIRHSFHIFNVIEDKNIFQLSLVIICGEDKNAFLQNDIFILQCNGQINGDNDNDEEKKQDGADNDYQNIFECMINENNWSVTKIEGIPFQFAPRFGHSSMVIPFDYIDDQQTVLRDIAVFGGYSGEMSVLNDFWLISIENNMKNGVYKLKECKNCSGIKNLPSPRHGHSMNLFNNNRLIIYGGINLQFETFSDIKIININLKEWKEMKQEFEKKQKIGDGGMTQNEKENAKQQLKNMGFGDDQIENALKNAQNFDQALGMLLG